MKKYILSLLLVSFICSQSFAQKYVDEESTFLERLYLGGNFGLQIGTNVTQIEVSPAVGYMVNNKFSAGVGVIYQYFKANVQGPSQVYEISTNIYGGKLFGRYNITDFLFAYTEFENINLDVANFSTQEVAREWVPGMFVGAGYFQPIGRRAGVNLMLLYNLLYDPLKSPYNNAFVLRLGFSL
ncbi:hypothetical protein GCM10011506_11500 [Marivirga lumbricoides]|uniref:Outer membrane protein beta-barrel domain-containing protein n=1 Tax=Marivirga lumbricoides TaxID=1046115 RepID=A0ABQ1LQ12_9BACT|nr:hypothetical protein GCM10011506_11500 [Marivirga lumbricoides]